MLERMLATHKPKVFFVNGALQNPTGSVLSASVAHHILQFAERFDFMVIEDDVCSDFQNEITVRMAALDQLHRVIYLGSFSKSLSCSLRVGFIAATPKMIKALTDVKMLTSISSSRFAEEVVSVVLNNGGYRKSIERIRRRLDRQMSATLRLAENSGWEFFARPSGGMFIWTRWHGVSDSAVLVESAATLGVDLSPGALFHPAKCESAWLRINVAYATDPRAIEFISNPLQKRANGGRVSVERSKIAPAEPKVSGI
jgi:DNA-binding transcriptional MocR family regulator